MNRRPATSKLSGAASLCAAIVLAACSSSSGSPDKTSLPASSVIQAPSGAHTTHESVPASTTMGGRLPPDVSAVRIAAMLACKPETPSGLVIKLPIPGVVQDARCVVAKVGRLEILTCKSKAALDSILLAAVAYAQESKQPISYLREDRWLVSWKGSSDDGLSRSQRIASYAAVARYAQQRLGGKIVKVDA